MRAAQFHNLRVDASGTCLDAARVRHEGGPFLHANLSPMLPEFPRALNPDFVPNSDSALSDSFAAQSDPVEHHSHISPPCRARVVGHHCKLVCTQCGYYLSCADYY